MLTPPHKYIHKHTDRFVETMSNAKKKTSGVVINNQKISFNEIKKP